MRHLRKELEMHYWSSSYARMSLEHLCVMLFYVLKLYASSKNTFLGHVSHCDKRSHENTPDNDIMHLELSVVQITILKKKRDRRDVKSRE